MAATWFIVGVVQYAGATEAGKASQWFTQWRLDHIDESVPHINNHTAPSTLLGTPGCDSQFDFEWHFSTPTEEQACLEYAELEQVLYQGARFEETGIGPADCNTSFSFSSE